MVKDKKAVGIRACLDSFWQLRGRHNLLGVPGDEVQKVIMKRICFPKEVFKSFSDPHLDGQGQVSFVFFLHEFPKFFGAEVGERRSGIRPVGIVCRAKSNAR
jgi:hypothetical protein